jgi:hypothetical protein
MRRALLLAAAALCACNTGFEPQYRVRDVRILALRSNAQGSASADVSPTDTLALEALVVNPRGRAGLTVDWIACVPQASDAIPPCLDQAWLADPARLLAAAGTVPGVVSLGTGTSVTTSIPDVTAALEFAIYGAQVEPTFACRLFAQLVVVAVARAEGVSSTSYKLVPILPTPALLAAATPPVTSQYVVNLNPHVGEVRRDPADPDACTGGTLAATLPFPSGDVVLCGLGTNDAAQTYNLCEPGGAISSALERLDWQWYVTDGEFPDVGGVGDARGGHVKFRRPAGPFTLWSLVRDGRGGVEWSVLSYPAQ